MTNEMHSTAYTPVEDCESHWTYGEITELPLRADTTTLGDLLRIARRDLGSDAVIELDQELVLSLSCPQCGTREEVLEPISKVGFNRAHCPACGLLRETELSHTITGDEDFLDRTLSTLGVPALHILRAFNASEYRFYELNADLPEALHFKHFERRDIETPIKLSGKIKLGEKVVLKSRPKIKIHEPDLKIKTPAESDEKISIKIKDSK
jgi:adenylyltransferase/sulfurtransferase